MMKAGMKANKRNRFRPGTHGGCEALLYEFREHAPSEPSEGVGTPTIHSRVALIAAETFDEALTYLHFDSPGFDVQNVRCLGLILMVSGSPAD